MSVAVIKTVHGLCFTRDVTQIGRPNPRNRVAQKLLKQLSPEFARATEGQHAAGLSAREGTDIFSEIQIAFLDGASYILATINIFATSRYSIQTIWLLICFLQDNCMHAPKQP